jgi:UDP-N-acetylmuramate dehydrogenase
VCPFRDILPVQKSQNVCGLVIEKAGFTKGTSSGRAAISSKHTLALVNRGGASAAEILALGREIRRRVEELFGVRLIAEPVFLGFDEEF